MRARGLPGLLVGAALAAGALAGRDARADDFKFTKAPYLQGLGTKEVVVRWEGSQGVGGSVIVTGANGFTREVKTTEPSPFHSVEVTGLSPATTYTYVVKAGDAKSSEGRFVTAPEGTKPFSFLLYGDNRTDEVAHESVVKAMLKVPSDLLLHTGDMVLDGGNESEWGLFFGIEAPLIRDRSVFSCIGNHEMLGGGAARWLRYFHPGTRGGGEPTLYYSVRWSNTRFFFLNAMASWVNGSDRQWLEAELTRSDAEPNLENRIVVLHHGPFSSGPHGVNEALSRASVLPLLRAHKVTAVFAGHDHVYERGERDGIRYIVSGGGGAPVYKPRRNPHVATSVIEAAHHFVEGKIEGPVLTTIARRLDGSIMETCVAKPGAPWACQGVLPPVERPSQKPPPPDEPETKKRACDCAIVAKNDDFAPAWLALLGVAALVWRRRR